MHVSEAPGRLVFTQMPQVLEALTPHALETHVPPVLDAGMHTLVHVPPVLETHQKHICRRY